MSFIVKNSTFKNTYLIDFNKIIYAYLFSISLICVSAQVFAKSNENLTIPLLHFVQSGH
jgi:hypothetical protein